MLFIKSGVQLQLEDGPLLDGSEEVIADIKD
jgi:hypothetical protein